MIGELRDDDPDPDLTLFLFSRFLFCGPRRLAGSRIRSIRPTGASYRKSRLREVLLVAENRATVLPPWFKISILRS